MSKKALENLFDSRARVRLLKFFFRNYPRTHTLREVARHLQENPRLVKKEMARLLQAGLILKTGGKKNA